MSTLNDMTFASVLAALVAKREGTIWDDEELELLPAARALVRAASALAAEAASEAADGNDESIQHVLPAEPGCYLLTWDGDAAGTVGRVFPRRLIGWGVDTYGNTWPLAHGLQSMDRSNLTVSQE